VHLFSTAAFLEKLLLIFPLYIHLTGVPGITEQAWAKLLTTDQYNFTNWKSGRWTSAASHGI